MGKIQIIAPVPGCSVLEIAQTEIQATESPNSFLTPQASVRLRAAFVACLLLQRLFSQGLVQVCGLGSLQHLKATTNRTTSPPECEERCPARQAA